MPRTGSRRSRAIGAGGRAAAVDAPLAWRRFESETALSGPLGSRRTVVDLVA